MMFNCLALALVSSAALLLVSASPETDYIERSICDRFPHLRLCALRSDVDQSIQEVAFMLRAFEHQQAQVFVAQPSEEAINGKDKRKSTYVRFGKRSDTVVAEDSSAEQQPVDLLINQRPTRKSAFVRFG
ncbi:Flp-17 [Aphelenchoides bicaudatus]|nr:Flp-17 [Aphelenchoides bicaudatus]